MTIAPEWHTALDRPPATPTIDRLDSDLQASPTQLCSTAESDSTTDLVQRCRVGDQRAWDELIARYGRLVYSIARRHRLGSAECDDVSQATWMRLVQRIDTIRTPESVGDWLATVARNESLRILTRDRRAVPMAEPLDSRAGLVGLVDPHDPEALAMQADDLRQVAAAVATLTPQHRELLRLVLLDPPPSYAEIAERLCMPVSSVGPTRTRCLRKLRAALAGHDLGVA